MCLWNHYQLEWSDGDTGFTWFDLRSAEGSLLVPLWRQCLDRSWQGGFLLVARCARAFLETKISCSTSMPSFFSKISQESKIELAASCMLQCHPTAYLWNFLGSLKKSRSILTGTKHNCLVRGVPCESSELCQDFGWDYTFSTFHDLWPPSVTACALAHWRPVPSEMPPLGNELTSWSYELRLPLFCKALNSTRLPAHFPFSAFQIIIFWSLRAVFRVSTPFLGHSASLWSPSWRGRTGCVQDIIHFFAFRELALLGMLADCWILLAQTAVWGCCCRHGQESGGSLDHCNCPCKGLCSC